MRSANLEFVIGQAADDRQTDAFAKAVASSIEVGVVVPSIFRAKLEKAGYLVVEDVAKVAEYGFKTTATLKRVLIADKAGNLIAMGAASDHDEALLAAALGWFREHPLEDADVPAGILEAPEAPAPVS